MIEIEERTRILKARARALAQEPIIETTGPTIDVIEFSLATERYGIEIAYVREVFPFKELTPVPCTPGFIVGIANIRGRMITVIDLKIVFTLAEEGIHDRHNILIVQNDEIELGILANEVFGVRVIPLNQLQASLPTLTGIHERFVRGVTDDRLVVLDAGKLLADDKLSIDEEVS